MNIHMTKTTLIKSTKRQYFKNDEKRQLVREYLESGMTHNSFCKKMGIANGSLTAWKDKFKGELGSHSNGACEGHEEHSTSVPAVTTQVVSPEYILAECAKLQHELNIVRGELGTIRRKFADKLLELEIGPRD
jgi:transposase-like protein